MSKTENGITFTVNSDGSVTANGTATAQTTLSLKTPSWIHDVNSDCIISGAKNGSSTTYEIYLWDEATSVAYRSREGVDAIIPASVYGHRVNCQLMVRSGAVLSNVTVYPMIRKASVVDDTYEPYHDSVAEEIEQIYSANGVLGAKNLCESRCPSETINGITFTKNSDGSYTISGTNDGTATSVMRIDQSTKTGTDNLKNYHGRYTLSLKDANGDGVAPIMVLMQNSTWTSGLALASNAGEVTGNIDLDNCFIYISVALNASFTNPITVYPMLRLASDTDSTYQPFAMTNKELTEEVNELSDKVGFIECVKFTIARQSSKTFYMPAQSQVRFCGFGVATAIFDMIAFVQNAGTVNVAEIYKGSSISHSEASNAFTITNGAAGAVTIYAYVFNGSVQDTPLTS